MAIFHIIFRQIPWVALYTLLYATLYIVVLMLLLHNSAHTAVANVHTAVVQCSSICFYGSCYAAAMHPVLLQTGSYGNGPSNQECFVSMEHVHDVKRVVLWGQAE